MAKTSTKQAPPHTEHAGNEMPPKALEAFELVYNAYTYLRGLEKLFSNMHDEPLQWVEPFEMSLLLQPCLDRLRSALSLEDYPTGSDAPASSP